VRRPKTKSKERIQTDGFGSKKIESDVRKEQVKSIKIYELFDWFGTIQSGMTNYKHDAKVLHVAAVSIKQAYYLAGHGLWVGQNDGVIGIVEKRVDPDCTEPWLFFDGTRQAFAKFEHGDSCKRELDRLLANEADAERAS